MRLLLGTGFYTKFYYISGGSGQSSGIQTLGACIRIVTGGMYSVFLHGT